MPLGGITRRGREEVLQSGRLTHGQFPDNVEALQDLLFHPVAAVLLDFIVSVTREGLQDEVQVGIVHTIQEGSDGVYEGLQLVPALGVPAIGRDVHLQVVAYPGVEIPAGIDQLDAAGEEFFK